MTQFFQLDLPKGFTADVDVIRDQVTIAEVTLLDRNDKVVESTDMTFDHNPTRAELTKEILIWSGDKI